LLRGRITDDLAHGRLVIIFKPPAQGIGHEFFGHRAWKLFRVLEERRAQSRKAVDLHAAGHRSACVHGLAGFVNIPPGTDDVIILESEPQRIDDRMTTVARGFLAVLGKPFAHGGRNGTGLGLECRVHSRRRRRNR